MVSQQNNNAAAAAAAAAGGGGRGPAAAFGLRRLLRIVALATGFIGAIPAAAMGQSHSHTARSLDGDHGTGSTAPVRPFRLDQVRLGDGLLQEKRDKIKSFLRDYDERRFLILFNNQAGRPNPEGLQVPGGWEDGGLLSGHWAGHYMTALSQAYADQGEEVYKTKLDWMVNELAACQEAITARMGNGTGGQPQPDPGNVTRVEGKFGKALRLGEAPEAQYITLPQETINQLRDFTIAAWVNMPAAQSWSRLFDFGLDTTTNMFLALYAGSQVAAPRFAITTGGSAQEQRIDGSTAIPTGEWVHIAVTMAGEVGTLYVNGQVSGTNTAMSLSPTDLKNPGNRWIGRSQYGDPLLNAAVDEFHIFDRALDAAEVQSLQESAAGSTGGGNIAWYRFDEEDGGSALKDSSPNGRDAGVVGEAGDGSGNASWIPTYPGYLGALPEDTVLRLGPPRWAVYGGNAQTNTWAPWYTQHKIMRGLLDAFYNTDNKQALQVVTRMADWAYLALTIGDKNQPGYQGNLTRDDLNYMWDLYIAGEYGGANEVFPEIYDLTGDDKHLHTAKAFDNRESLFEAAVEDRDILVVKAGAVPGRRRPQRLHANTHVPQFIGYMRIYEQGGGSEYLEAARNFYGWVVPHREFATGGTSGNYPGSNNNAEMFQNRDNIANAMAADGAETCTTYNMLKLARNLFLHDHDAAYMDTYERGLFNMITGSRADAESPGADDPQLTYFQPLTPGSTRDYGNAGTCCGGSGLESHTKYQETVYLRSADASAVWVNLYVPSTLTWAERGLVLQQETAFPRNDTVKFTVKAADQRPLELRLRVPAWVRPGERGFVVKINGKRTQPVQAAAPGSYMGISRAWTAGDVVEVRMPFSVRTERALDRPDTQALLWGPVLLQVVGTPPGGRGTFWELSLYRYLKRDGDYSSGGAVTRNDSTAAGDPLFAVGGGVGPSLRPYYISDGAAVSSYFRRVEPEVVFGGLDAGVPNRHRNDGLPRYDVPVDGITSPGTDGPTFLDVLWDRAPFPSHNVFVATVADVAAGFVRLGVYNSSEADAIVATARMAEKELRPVSADA